MADAPIVVRGPIPPGSTTPQPPDTPLYLSDESTVSTETDTQKQDIPTLDSDESILAPISGKQFIRGSGVIQGRYLSQNPSALVRRSDISESATTISYSPKTAYRLYVYQLESLVIPRQGSGYIVRDEVRDKTFEPSSDTFGVLFDSVTHEYNTGEGFKGSWDVSGQVTDGVQQADSRVQYIDEQVDKLRAFDRDQAEVATSSTSVTLGEIEKMNSNREIDLNSSDLVHQQDKKEQVNVSAIDSGVKESFTFEGRIADHQTDKTLSQVARDLGLNIHGEQAELYDTITGRKLEGAITDSESTFVAGEPDKVEYRVELDIGRSVADKSNAPPDA